MSRRRFKAVLGYLVYVLGWSYVSFILVWFGLRLLFFDRIWWLALLNTLAFFLFVPLVLLIPLVICFRRWRLAIGLLIPVILFVGLFGDLLTPQLKTLTPVQQQAFRVMSFNMLWDNQNYSQITKAVQTANPDIIGLQEVRPPNIDKLKQALSDYPYSAFHPPDQFHTVGIVSRFPIASAVPLPNPPMRRGLRVIVNVNGKQLMVIVAHLAPNNMPLYPLSEFVAETKERYARRTAEVEQLKQEIQTHGNAAVVLCDCNLTDTSQTYDQLQTVLTDSFAAVGWGLGHTLQNEALQLPIQRIDYVWHTADLQAVDAHVGVDGGSDHLPIVATIQFPQK